MGCTPVNPDDPGNLIYILGGDSSGKTALLTAIEALSPDGIPGDDKRFPRFKNFNPTNEIPSLIAQFGSSNRALNLPRFMADVEAAFEKANAHQPEVVSSAQFHTLVQAIKSSIAEVYTRTIIDLGAADTIWVKRTSFGEYFIGRDPAFEDRRDRLDTAQRAKNAAFRSLSGEFTSTEAKLPIAGAFRIIALLTASH